MGSRKVLAHEGCIRYVVIMAMGSGGSILEKCHFKYMCLLERGYNLIGIA